MKHDNTDLVMSPEIHRLVDSLLGAYDYRYGVGTMTCSVYDTAWVANVCKTVAGTPQYLFPSSFKAILQAQKDDGSWAGHFNVDNYSLQGSSSKLTDSILSTMASLYTLTLHHKNPYQIRANQIPLPALETRIGRATSALEKMLRAWHVGKCDAVGFEILAPGMLDVLSKEGIEICFDSREALLDLRDAKLRRLSPEQMYKLGPSALLHSLEAFHGWETELFDVNKVQHHMVGGSMMASPAATASYLMKVKDWDDVAEAYLRLAIQCGEGHGNGCVPSAYPSTNFEVLWVISTLVEFHLCSHLDASKALEIIAQCPTRSDGALTGLVGFSPGIEPDLDDSAKASIITSLSGRPGCSEDIVKEFSTPLSLKTYRGERNPSISANCNALLCLLVDESEYEGKSSTIKKIIAFVHDAWMNDTGEIKDKWNISPHYTLMLISRSLVELLSRWSSGGLPAIGDDVIALQVVPLLLKCLSMTLEAQRYDGAWGSVGPFEETAYAILALVSLLCLPLPAHLSRKTCNAVEAGRKFLLTRGDAHCEFLWVEKVTYGSKHLMDTYVLAALNAKTDALCKQHTIPSAVLSYHDSIMDDMLLLQNGVEALVNGRVEDGMLAQA